MVTWFAGVFYLPRLFVYHAMAEDAASRERFKVMERKLYWGIMAPGAVLTILFGMLLLNYVAMGAWLYAKLGGVVLLIPYHLYCRKPPSDFTRERNTKSHFWYRWFNEAPVAFLPAPLALALGKPL